MRALVFSIVLFSAAHAAAQVQRPSLVERLRIMGQLAAMEAEDAIATTTGAADPNPKNPLAADPKAYAALKASSAYAGYLAEVARRNSLALKALFAKTGGFISPSIYGREAALHVFRMVEHADQDRALQQAYLDGLKANVKSDKDIAEYYAFIYDRLELAAKRPQRYGTQGGCVGKTWKLTEPIESREHVDERRREVGLDSIDEQQGEKEMLRECSLPK